MVAEAPARDTAKVAELPPPVYFAGPVDYVEHRGPADHLRDNWRHRFFGDLPITLICPVCDARVIERDTDPEAVRSLAPLFVERVMKRNTSSVQTARYFVGFFPGDVATFGTPVEVWEWCRGSEQAAILIHPSKPGVLVRHLERDYGLVVVQSFFDARTWLLRQLNQ